MLSSCYSGMVVFRKSILSILLTSSPLAGFAAEPEFTAIDLSNHVWKKWSDIQPGTSWAAVPRGLQVIGGTPFKLDGMVEVTGMGAARAGSPRPAQVTGIPANVKATHIHLLHGTGYDAPDETPIAAVTLNFASGESRSFAIEYGVHVRNWWVEPTESSGSVTDPGTEVAWTGGSPETDPRQVTLRLFRSRFVNPLPDQEIRSIDFSSLFSRATPVLVGLALENTEQGDLAQAERAAARAKEHLATLRNSVSMNLSSAEPNTRFERTRVRVEVEERGRTIDLGSFTSDGSGAVHLYFPPTSQSLAYYVEGPDFVTERGMVELADGKAPEPIQVALKRGTLIGGKVQSRDGQPIAGAKISLSVATPEESGEIGSVETDASGNWTAANIPPDYTALDLTVTHPDYTPVDYEQADQAGPQQVAKGALLERNAVLTLNPAPAVAGIVKDAQGMPVPGAAVTVRVSPRLIQNGKSDHSGAFRVIVLEGDEADLIVQADGHAPFHRRLSLTGDNERVQITLEKGQRLAGRVIEGENAPLSKVQVAVESWNAQPGVNWRTETDTEGHFVWENAPSGPIILSFTRSGYQKQTSTFTAPSSDTEITMSRSFRLSGTVTDAETKQPIPSFRIVPGQVWGGPEDNVQWERRSTISGQDGKYVAEQTLQHGELRFMITAEGYQPVASPAYPPAGWHTFDAELRKAKRPEGIVKNKDGEPVEKAAVATLGTGYLMLSEGTLRTYDRTRPFVLTDATGHFQLEEALGDSKVIFVHEQFGYAESTIDAVRASSEISLQPWARIEGQLKIGSTNAGAGRDVMLAPRMHGPGELSYDYEKYKKTTDADGKFIIDFVPPGERQLVRLIPIHRGAGWSHLTPFTIAPGETKNVVIGGAGRPVIGKLLTSDPEREVNWRAGHHSLGTRYPKPPGPFKSAEEARAWQRSPEVQEAQRNRRSYTLEFSDDGSFVVSDVIPGDYTLGIHLTKESEDGGFGGEFLGSLSHQVTVPEIEGGQTDEPLDLGTLTVQLRNEIKTGMPAPPIEAKTLEGRSFNLKELLGKYVLLDFWATWCGPCVAEVPTLKAAFDKYGKDANFVMAGLSLDADIKEPQEFVKKKNLPWTQVFLGEWANTSIPNAYGVTGIPATFLIDPQGKIVEKGLRGETLLPTLERYLSRSISSP